MSLKPISAPKERNLSHIIDFGKYKGQTIRDILLLDPQYLLWAHENVERLKLSRAILVKAEIEAANIAEEMDDRREDYYYGVEW